MNADQITEKVVEVIGDCIDEKIPADTSFDLREAGMLDSLLMMNVMASLEDEFDVEFEPKDMTKENFLSVDTMCALIKKYL